MLRLSFDIVKRAYLENYANFLAVISLLLSSENPFFFKNNKSLLFSEIDYLASRGSGRLNSPTGSLGFLKPNPVARIYLIK